jgi:hypothetical protein
VERLARNREAAAVSRARRRAAADGLDTRCRELQAANTQLQTVVARLAAENHALRAHILANCPPPVPPPASAPAAPPAAAPPAQGAPTPLAVLPPGPLALPLPLPLPLQKLPLPRFAVAVRPAPAAPRKTLRTDGTADDGGKRTKRTMLTAAATVLFSLALISSPMFPTTAPPSPAERSSMRALAPPAPEQPALQPAASSHSSLLLASNAIRPDEVEAELLVLAAHAASPAPANSTAVPLPPQPPPLPELNGDTAPFPSDALVPLFSGDAGALDELPVASSPHARWLTDTWRPLLSLPLSDERAIASLKALAIYAGGGGAGRTTAALGDGSSSSTAWSPPQQAAWWLAPTPAPMSCHKLFEFSTVDADVVAEADSSGAAPVPAPAPAPPRALRRLGGAWPLPPTAREAAAGEGTSRRTTSSRIPAAGASASEDVVVSLLEPPPELSFGGASAGNGFGFSGTTQGGGNANSRAVLVVVLLQSAARYLTYSCTM